MVKDPFRKYLSKVKFVFNRSRVVFTSRTSNLVLLGKSLTDRSKSRNDRGGSFR